MGDMADYYLELSYDDGFEEDGFEEDTEPPNRFTKSRRPIPRIPACRCCGKSPLVWKSVNEEWILFEADGGIHICPVNPISIERMKDILKHL